MQSIINNMATRTDNTQRKNQCLRDLTVLITTLESVFGILKDMPDFNTYREQEELLDSIQHNLSQTLQGWVDVHVQGMKLNYSNSQSVASISSQSSDLEDDIQLGQHTPDPQFSNSQPLFSENEDSEHELHIWKREVKIKDYTSSSKYSHLVITFSGVGSFYSPTVCKRSNEHMDMYIQPAPRGQQVQRTNNDVALEP